MCWWSFSWQWYAFEEREAGENAPEAQIRMGLRGKGSISNGTFQTPT